MRHPFVFDEDAARQELVGGYLVLYGVDERDNLATVYALNAVGEDLDFDALVEFIEGLATRVVVIGRAGFHRRMGKYPKWRTFPATVMEYRANG